MSDRKKILWLVSWYPNKYDPFDGDFIQRHAKAAALYNDIHVLFIKAFDEQVKREEESCQQDGLAEQLIYLPKSKTLTGKIKSFFDWQQVYKIEVSEVIKNFKPQLVHVHIPWKAGLIALWAKKKFNLPFVVTEHWGIYNDVVKDNIYTKSFFVRYFLKRIYKEAELFVSVSRYIGSAVNKCLLTKDFVVIPNVVDTELFFPVQKKREQFSFLHVSNMVPLKNVEGILTAFQQFLVKTGKAASLILVGNKDDKYEKLAEEMNLLNRSVFFKGEISYPYVAKEMQGAHVLVLNSRMENSPCVIGEALCCGLPVIATDVGGIPELISAANGLLVPPDSVDDLEVAFSKAYEMYEELVQNRVDLTASTKFSPRTIGKQIAEVYEEVLQRL